jgi:hypothetical protein
MNELCPLAAAIEAGNVPLPPFIGKLIQNAPESLADHRAGQIAVTLRAMRHAGEPVNFAIIGERHLPLLTFIGTELSNAALPLEEAEFYAEKCWQAFQVRRAQSIFGEAHASIIAAPEQTSSIISTARAALDDVTSDTDSLAERLKGRIYSAQVKPIEPKPRFFLAGVQISTAGNLTTVSAQAKAGKSAAIAAMIGSTFAASDADCLGFTSENPNGHAEVHIDTEQTPFDHWEGNQRTIRRAKVDAAPPWLRSYCLTGFSAADVRRSIHILTEQAAKKFGGVHSVFVDGIADAMHDVNDPAETSSLITELHKLAIEFDCPVLNIVHLNPGSDFKTRGHLGSQLERKSETNLRLEKDDTGATVIWADKNRRAPIPKHTAPRFAWSDEAGMHVSIASNGSIKENAKLDEWREQCREAFSIAKKAALTWTDLVESLLKVPGVKSKRTAERIHTDAKREGIIIKNIIGQWELA